jgi:hypothetical protein
VKNLEETHHETHHGTTQKLRKALQKLGRRNSLWQSWKKKLTMKNLVETHYERLTMKNSEKFEKTLENLEQLGN